MLGHAVQDTHLTGSGRAILLRVWAAAEEIEQGRADFALGALQHAMLCVGLVHHPAWCWCCGCLAPALRRCRCRCWCCAAVSAGAPAAPWSSQTFERTR